MISQQEMLNIIYTEAIEYDGCPPQRLTARQGYPLPKIMNESKGQLDVLNVGTGDLKIIFDEKNMLEVERTKRIIGDMLKRGYSLFVHGKDDALTRVKRFDAKNGLYIIADGPTVAPEPATHEPVSNIVVVKRGPGRPKKGEAIVSMTKAKATVIGRSAGG